MNEFDTAIILFLNQYAHISTVFDKFIVVLSSNHLLKGGVITFLLWYALFNVQDDSLRKTAFIFTILSTIIAMSIARFLAIILPLRLRPLHEESINFTLPYDVNIDLLDGWNSMPSDHATLFFTLSMCLYFVSKKIALLAFFYTTFFICLPRVYLGLHYPSDIFVGAFIGIFIARMIIQFSLLSYFSKKISHSPFGKPPIFYALSYVFIYQIADMFDSTRHLLKAFVLFLKSIGLS